MLGCLLFNYPILALFNRPADFLGIPVAVRMDLRCLDSADCADGARGLERED